MAAMHDEGGRGSDQTMAEGLESQSEREHEGMVGQERTLAVQQVQAELLVVDFDSDDDAS